MCVYRNTLLTTHIYQINHNFFIFILGTNEKYPCFLISFSRIITPKDARREHENGTYESKFEKNQYNVLRKCSDSLRKAQFIDWLNSWEVARNLKIGKIISG